MTSIGTGLSATVRSLRRVPVTMMVCSVGVVSAEVVGGGRPLDAPMEASYQAFGLDPGGPAGFPAVLVGFGVGGVAQA